MTYLLDIITNTIIW